MRFGALRSRWQPFVVITGVALVVGVVCALVIILRDGSRGYRFLGRRAAPPAARSCDGYGPIRTVASTDANWTKGLAIGVNGPIPLIVVDQFGYRTNARKLAVIRDPVIGYDSAVDFTPSERYALVELSTGATRSLAAPVAWRNGNIDVTSGDRAWWLDFSSATSPGNYSIVDQERQVHSTPFRIADDVYSDVLRAATRVFFYQRAGAEKSARYAGRYWADGASHLRHGQDSEAKAWLARQDSTVERDLRGGWYDAGDFNRYTNWTARNIIVLLHAYAEHPSAFDDDFGIPESGNGVADVLDEVKWGIDWLTRMQLDNGALLCVLASAAGTPPSSAIGASYYGPPTTSATLMGAAAFAFAAKVFESTQFPSLRQFAAALELRARNAWTWAASHPTATYYNNDESKQAGSGGLAGGQQEMDASARAFAQLEAAIYLFDLDQSDTYRKFIESHGARFVADSAVNQWTIDRQDALLYLTTIDGISEDLKRGIVNWFLSGVVNNSGQLPLVQQLTDPYAAPIEKYTWGSNNSKAAEALIFQHFALLTNDRQQALAARDAAEAYLHYLHGVNPLGMVYLTNMQCSGAEHSARTMFHEWFAQGTVWDRVTDTNPGPAPGFLVGGPNADFSLDPCCEGNWLLIPFRCRSLRAWSVCSCEFRPPRGQPAQKAYLEFNDAWPANSWAITEPSLGYQARYVRALAAYVQ